jgi:hypothetical protein
MIPRPRCSKRREAFGSRRGSAGPEKFASIDQGIYGHITRRNLAELARERGNDAEAESLWRAVLAECPGDRDAIRNLNAKKFSAPTDPN